MPGDLLFIRKMLLKTGTGQKEALHTLSRMQGYGWDEIGSAFQEAGFNVS